MSLCQSKFWSKSGIGVCNFVGNNHRLCWEYCRLNKLEWIVILSLVALHWIVEGVRKIKAIMKKLSGFWAPNWLQRMSRTNRSTQVAECKIPTRRTQVQISDPMRPLQMFIIYLLIVTPCSIKVIFITFITRWRLLILRCSTLLYFHRVLWKESL